MNELEWGEDGIVWASIELERLMKGPNSTLNLQSLGRAIKAVLLMGIPPQPPGTP